MGLNYKQFLYNKLQDTKWGDIIQTVGEWLDDYKTATIDSVENVFSMNDLDFDKTNEICNTFGHVLTSLTGYTSTEIYFKKQLLTLIDRKRFKRTLEGYRKTGWIYNIDLTPYPTYISDDSTYYRVFEEFWESAENFEFFSQATTFDANLPNIKFYLDGGRSPVYDETAPAPTPENYSFDEGEETDSGIFFSSAGLNILYYVQNPDVGIPDNTYPYPPTTDPFAFDEGLFFDGEIIASALGRIILVSYKYIYCESETEFMSKNTCISLEKDLKQIKEVTSSLCFEPCVVIDANFDLSTNTTLYRKYDTPTVWDIEQNSKLYLYPGNPFLEIAEIRLGDGSNADLTIATDLDNTIASYTTGDFEIEEIDTNYVRVRKKVIPTDDVLDFSEVGFFDSLGNMILYSTFPKVNYKQKAFKNWCFEVNIL